MASGKKQTNTVAFYLRVSTRHQDTKEGSLTSQEQRLKEWMDFQNNIAVDNEKKKKYDSFLVYKDVESGKSAANRPGYNRMLADLQMNKINAIACTSISRLNRNLKEFYSLLDISEQYQIDIVSLKEHFDTSTAMGRALLKFMLVFYELEREQTAERGSDNRYARAKRGLWLTSTIMGYEKDPINTGYLNIIPSEAEVIRKIFKLYIETGSISSVRKILKKDGIKTPPRKLSGTNKGTPQDFKDETIRRILHNKSYIGILQFQKKNIGKEGFPPGKAYEEFDGIWKPIISDENVFEKAQGIINANRHSKGNVISRKKKVYVLSGIIKCGDCEGEEKVKTTSGTSKTGRQYHYYKCVKCDNTVPAKKLESAVKNQLAELATDKDFIKILVESYQQNYNTDLMEQESRLRELKAEESRINSNIDLAIEKVLKMKDNKLEMFRERLQKKEDNLQQKLTDNLQGQVEIENDLMQIKLEGIDFDHLQLLLENLSELLETIPPINMKSLYNNIITELIMYNNRVVLKMSDDIYTLHLDKKGGQNEEFILTPIRRDRRDSNSRPLA